MTVKRRLELRYWLTSEEPDAVEWRTSVPYEERTAVLREYRDLMGSAFGILPQYVMVTDDDRAGAVENHAELAWA